MSFTYIASASDWVRIVPLLVLAGVGLLTLLADLLLPQGEQARLALAKKPGASIPFSFLLLPLLGVVGLLGALAASLALFALGDHQSAFYGMLASDQGTLYAYIILCSAALLTILLSPGYIKRQGIVHQGEYYALLLFATLGMMILVAAQNFLIIFVGIELLSLALYILCGYLTRRSSSQEAGMKYFLLSSFASAFLLYGLALIYGATGQTQFAAIASFLRAHATASTLLLIGMGLLTVGFAFKVSAMPFHAWTPDVYEGAPSPITAFMSVGTKAAAILAFARVFLLVLAPLRADWLPTLWAITLLTMVGGNLMALGQKNVKRMLAYSSIAHAGYLLIGVVAGNTNDAPGMSALLFYLLCYTFLNIGALGVVSVLERLDNSGTSLADLRGLWRRQPLLAGLLAFFLFGLAGFPPMAGFAAKYYIFYTAMVSGHPELLIVGVLASVLGMYYYLRPIASMFMEREEVVPTAPSRVAEALPALASRRVSGKTRPRAGTALAVRTAPAVPKPLPAAARRAALEDRPAEERIPTAWPTKVALVLAVLGSLALGTFLPFWLIQLAQQAAHMM